MGVSVDDIFKITAITPYFLQTIKEIVDYAQTRPTKILEYFDGVFEFTDAEKQKYFGEAVAKIQAWTAAQGGA